MGVRGAWYPNGRGNQIRLWVEWSAEGSSHEQLSGCSSLVRHNTPSMHVLWLVLGRVRSLLMMVE
jgi:hypothetical protein